MELKIKYQYTYFIKPFMIDKNKYEKYLESLLKRDGCKLKIFEKERDLNLYSFFIQNAREYYFPTFSFNSETIKRLESMNNLEKSKFLSKFSCNVFEYNLSEKTQGKTGKDGIFFNIDKVEIICFDTGICFLLIKTNIENTNNFSDLLDFNYKFKDINSDFNMLKEYNNIKIQTDTFENSKSISDYINDIIGIKLDVLDKNEFELYNKRLFVYTYCCIDQKDWSNEEDFSTIENDFIKYTNVLSNSNLLSFNGNDYKNNFDHYKEFKYAEFGFTKQSASLFTSSIDINNYNRVLFDYENEYLYTLLICLYQRIYLKKIEYDLKNKNKLNELSKRIYKFTKEIMFNEITNSVTGTMYYKKWQEVFEINESYIQLRSKFEIIYKELNIDNTSKVNKVVLIALVVSLLLNLINFIAILKLK